MPLTNGPSVNESLGRKSFWSMMMAYASQLTLVAAAGTITTASAVSIIKESGIHNAHCVLATPLLCHRIKHVSVLKKSKRKDKGSGMAQTLIFSTLSGKAVYSDSAKRYN